MAGATRVSSSLVTSLSSMAELRAYVPAQAGVEVEIGQYWPEQIGLGGGHFTSVADTTSVDDGGFVNVRVSPQFVWRRTIGAHVSLWDGGARSGDYDNGPVFQNIDKINHPVEFPRRWFVVKTPIVWSPNKGIALFSNASKGTQSNIVWQPGPEVGPDEACIRLTGSQANFTYSGITLNNFTVTGGDAVNHGVVIEFAGYLRTNSLRVIGFRGHGFYGRMIQDASNVDIEVQRCGRTSGDYSVAADCVGDLVTHTPIYIDAAGVTGDASNMIRFYGGQVENNNVTPYIKFNGGIGYWVERMHMEHRSGPLAAAQPIGAAIRVRNCDVQIIDMQATQFEWCIETEGYGGLTVHGMGRNGGIRDLPVLGNYIWRLTQCAFTKTAPRTNNRIYASMCRFGDTTWTFPSNRSDFSACEFGALNISDAGANCVVNFVGCTFSSVTTARVTGLKFDEGQVTGNLTFDGSPTCRVNIDILGTATVNTQNGVDYSPRGAKFKSVQAANTVPAGTNDSAFPSGSRWRNTNIAGLGSIVEQVRTNVGWGVISRVEGTAGASLRIFASGSVPPASDNRGVVCIISGIATESPQSQVCYSDGADWRLVAKPTVTVS